MCADSLVTGLAEARIGIREQDSNGVYGPIHHQGGAVFVGKNRGRTNKPYDEYMPEMRVSTRRPLCGLNASFIAVCRGRIRGRPGIESQSSSRTPLTNFESSINEKAPTSVQINTYVDMLTDQTCQVQKVALGGMLLFWPELATAAAEIIRDQHCRSRACLVFQATVVDSAL